MNFINLDVGGQRLRMVGVERLGEVDLETYRDSNRRLVLIVAAQELFDDSIAHYIFNKVLGSRGLLWSVREADPAALALDLAVPVALLADWVWEHDVTVACCRVPIELVAAVALVACGKTVGDALEHVRYLSPQCLGSCSEEITVSVASEHVAVHQDLRRRRAEARARGESPWSVQ